MEIIKLLKAYRKGYKKGYEYGRNDNTPPCERTSFIRPPKYYPYFVRQKWDCANIVKCKAAINIADRIFFDYGKFYYCESMCYAGEFVVYWDDKINVVFDKVDFLNHFDYFHQTFIEMGAMQHSHNSNR